MGRSLPVRTIASIVAILGEAGDEEKLSTGIM